MVREHRFTCSYLLKLEKVFDFYFFSPIAYGNYSVGIRVEFRNRRVILRVAIGIYQYRRIHWRTCVVYMWKVGVILSQVNFLWLNFLRCSLIDLEQLPVIQFPHLQLDIKHLQSESSLIFNCCCKEVMCICVIWLGAQQFCYINNKAIWFSFHLTDHWQNDS